MVRTVSVRYVRWRIRKYPGCDIYAATSHAAGVVRDWNTVYRTAVKDTKISSGNNVGGIGTYGLSAADCTVSGCTITGSKYVGGVLGLSYNSTINSTGVVDSFIGTENASYVGGLVGGNYQDSATQTFAVVYNSFCKDSTVQAASAAGGIIGYARGGNYESNYSNATVIASENAGGFAGLADGYIMNSDARRRLQLKDFYFRGTVTAKLQNAAVSLVPITTANSRVTAMVLTIWERMCRRRSMQIR